MVEGDLEVVTVRRGVSRRFTVDEVLEHEIEERRREGLHLVELTVGDRIRDLIGPSLPDEVSDSGIHHHHLDRGYPTASEAREEPLAHDATQHPGEDRHDLPLLLVREELDHASDRLRRIEGVQRREDEVAGLRSLKRDLCRVRIAQLADEDDVGVLPQHAAERLREALRVEADLSLVDDAAAIAMEDLDGIFDGDDVLPASTVDLVDHRCKRRRLPGSGRAGDEHEPALLTRETSDPRRKV